MPLRHNDSFYDPTAITDRGVNPYLQEVKNFTQSSELKCIYAGDDLRSAAHDWRQAIGAGIEAPLILEVGCYKGETLVDFAQKIPATHFLGADITFKRLALSARRIRNLRISNAHLLFTHISGKALLELFQPGELDGIMVFYPDPWNRRRQRHNRLINEELVKSAWTVLKQDGFFWLKTDQVGYFHESRQIIENNGFLSAPEKLNSWLEQSRQTPFERRFNAQGIEKNEGFWQKSIAPTDTFIL